MVSTLLKAMTIFPGQMKASLALLLAKFEMNSINKTQVLDCPTQFLLLRLYAYLVSELAVAFA